MRCILRRCSVEDGIGGQLIRKGMIEASWLDENLARYEP
jgi:hypothetical protein